MRVLIGAPLFALVWTVLVVVALVRLVLTGDAHAARRP
jgi:hypothetical protein